MTKKQLVGITGFGYAGKSELFRFLEDEYEFRVVGASDIIHKKLVEETGRIRFTRAEMRDMGNMLRRQYGPDFVVTHALKLEETRIGIDGLRNLAASRTFRKMGGHILGLVARHDVRYNRAQSMSNSNKLVPVSVSELLASERSEMNSLDRNGMHILPILWETEPDDIIDTSCLTREEVAALASVRLEKWGIEHGAS